MAGIGIAKKGLGALTKKFGKKILPRICISKRFDIIHDFSKWV